MKNLSTIELNTNKEQVINMACSKTGLSDDVISKIYESQKIIGKTDQDIVDYFTNITETKNTFTTKEFMSSISTVFSEITKETDKTELTKKFLDILNDFDNEKKIDTVSLLSIVSEIISKRSNSDKNLLPLFDLKNILDETVILNESFNMVLQKDNDENTILLFEGLKQILTKNNSRWGVTYHIQNSYNAIMSYIDNEIQDIQLSKKMYSIDNEYHMIILNEMLSSNVSPLYKHVSSVKELIPDLQTLVFDMVLLINTYMENNQQNLIFINRQIYNDYKNAGNLLLTGILSSINNSHVINDFEKRNYFKPIENVDNVEESTPYWGYNNLSANDNLQKITRLLDTSLLKYDVWNISVKSVVDMLNFVKSSSTEFNLKIRPYIREYITKAYELTSSVEKSEILRANRTRY